MKEYYGLLAEDDKIVTDNYERNGLPHGIRFKVTARGDIAVGLAKTEDFDFAVVDLDLIGEAQGEDVIHALHERNKAMLTIVTSRCNSEARKMMTLEKGAVVYLHKPVTFDQLKAQLDALLRLKMDIDPILTNGSLKFNTATRYVFCGKRKPRLLTEQQAAILEYLMRRQNRPQSLEMIYEGITGEDSRTLVRHSLQRAISEVKEVLLGLCGRKVIETRKAREAYDGKETTYVIESPL